jgi:hypothetical protein
VEEISFRILKHKVTGNYKIKMAKRIYEGNFPYILESDITHKDINDMIGDFYNAHITDRDTIFTTKNEKQIKCIFSNLSNGAFEWEDVSYEDI